MDKNPFMNRRARRLVLRHARHNPASAATLVVVMAFGLLVWYLYGQNDLPVSAKVQQVLDKIFGNGAGPAHGTSNGVTITVPPDPFANGPVPGSTLTAGPLFDPANPFPSADESVGVQADEVITAFSYLIGLAKNKGIAGWPFSAPSPDDTIKSLVAWKGKVIPASQILPSDYISQYNKSLAQINGYKTAAAARRVTSL